MVFGGVFCLVCTVAFTVILHRTSSTETAPNYAAIGCFKDKVTGRAMKLLATYRKPSADPLDWNDLENTVIKKCAKKAMKTNSSFFGIQFYGECWGDSDQYDKYGPSSNCVRLNGANVGEKWANYVYMLTGEECANYAPLTEAFRSRDYKFDSSKGPQCDSFPYVHWKHTWYRFGAYAGRAMADECVRYGYGYCGTKKAGWFSGQLPGVKDGVQKGKVCFSERDDCCGSSQMIHIRNCGDFFVYKLPKTKGCFKAYCGDGQVSDKQK
ncbi:pancreatic secretory granule membrane major glycoprotein GP2-like [Montipora capricornis]|uniref:pancreatic secretory granule membrane major glycoprotein GP2-like n=1 Tax=Montipora capricornis TaxID=246305 RepID=UPI0035F1CE4A